MHTMKGPKMAVKLAILALLEARPDKGADHGRVP